MTTDTHRQASDTASKVLNRLNSTFGMPWREIALYVRPVPFSTLAYIAEGNLIPRKWLPRFRHMVEQERPDLFSYPTADLRWMLENRD